ncbi:MAG: hypothetical protein IID16_10890 [Candidatus Marinimicrobia bacterium]|nr:hypothetical protein [Candidatus Neomarinimicrobiota bacterium]
MSVMSIRIDDQKRKALKVITSLEGKTISSVIEELIDGYIQKKRGNLVKWLEDEQIMGIMGLSEDSFSEWDNEEDAVYDSL